MDFGTGSGEVEIDLAKVGVTGERVDAWPIAVEAEYVLSVSLFALVMSLRRHSCSGLQRAMQRAMQ